MNQARPLRLFISYSHEDDSFRRELEKHLAALERDGVIEVWSDREIGAGTEWELSITENLEVADIIMLLISPDFLASDFCYDREMKRAMDRHASGQARVIPVFLRHCDWKGAPFGRLQGVPDNARPIAGWPDRDQAFTIVADAIRKAAQSLRSPEPRSKGGLSDQERPPHPMPPGRPPTKGLSLGDATNDRTTKEKPEVAPTIADRSRSWLSFLEPLGNKISHAIESPLRLWTRQPRVFKLVLLALPAIIVALIIFIPPRANYETEPNGTFQTATTVNLGDTISGDISTPEDVDYYKIVVPPKFSDLVDLKLSYRSGDLGLIPEMKVYNELQKRIDSKFGVKGGDLSYTLDMPTGQQGRAFYVSVGGRMPAFYEGVGPYELSALPQAR